MPSSLAAADLQVSHGELSSGAPQQAQGLVSSGPSGAGDCLSAEKKHAESQGQHAQPCGKSSLEQGTMCMEERALAAGLQMLGCSGCWNAVVSAPGEGLQLGC